MNRSTSSPELPSDNKDTYSVLGPSGTFLGKVQHSRDPGERGSKVIWQIGRAWVKGHSATFLSLDALTGGEAAWCTLPHELRRRMDMSQQEAKLKHHNFARYTSATTARLFSTWTLRVPVTAASGR